MLFSFVQKERKEGKKGRGLTKNRCWRAFPAPCPFMAEIVLFPLCGLHLLPPRLEKRDHFGEATCPCIPGPPPAGDRANFCLGGQGCQAVGENTTDATVILLFPINPSQYGRKYFPQHITAPQECLADHFSQGAEQMQDLMEMLPPCHDTNTVQWAVARVAGDRLHMCFPCLCFPVPSGAITLSALTWSLAPSPAITPQCISSSVTLTRLQDWHVRAWTNCSRVEELRKGVIGSAILRPFLF